MTAAAHLLRWPRSSPSSLMPGGVALAGFLAGYRGLTREACALDLRQFTSWCRTRSVVLFAVRRAGIETFARDLEAMGRARATGHPAAVHHRQLLQGAVQEELLDRSPAAHVRRPRVDCESHAVALDRNEPGALLATAGLGPPAGHALISLLALNGLRVSEATGADIEHLGLERGHRTVTITRKGGKVVAIRWRRAPPGRLTWPSASTPKGRCSWPGTAGDRAARRRADRPRDRPPRRDSQARCPAYAAARVHHRRFGRRGAAARCARGGLARGPADDDAV